MGVDAADYCDCDVLCLCGDWLCVQWSGQWQGGLGGDAQCTNVATDGKVCVLWLFDGQANVLLLWHCADKVSGTVMAEPSVSSSLTCDSSSMRQRHRGRTRCLL